LVPSLRTLSIREIEWRKKMPTTTAYMLFLAALFYLPFAVSAGWPLWVAIPLFCAGVAHEVATHLWLRGQPCPFETDKPMDPLQEARVYKSYGRIDQARGILEAAISQAPDRDDLKQELANLGPFTR
jgi:hypothetical protein